MRRRRSSASRRFSFRASVSSRFAAGVKPVSVTKRRVMRYPSRWARVSCSSSPNSSFVSRCPRTAFTCLVRSS